jgi:hypothetical protein
MPWPLQREVAIGVSREVLARGPDANVQRRVALVARSYLLSEVVPDALGALERAVREGDVGAGAWSCVLVGWLGDDGQQRTAAAQFSRLLRAEAAVSSFSDLVQARAALGPISDLQELRELATQRIEALQGADDYASETEAAELDELVNNNLADLEWADEARAALSRTRAVDDALGLLLEVYFERSDYGGEEYLVPWSVLEIRKQAHVRGAVPVLAAFTREVEASRAARNTDPDREFSALRALRAVQYFGAALSPEDQRFLEEHADTQRDPLSTAELIPRSGSPLTPRKSYPSRGR